MTSASQSENPQQQQQQLLDHQLHPGGSATASPVSAPPPPSGKLSFEEISKYFSLPIAEAASNLGVCTSALKRICRENGIIRWPYRKFLAGKTVEDIRKDAERERTKELAELPKIANQRTDVSKVMPSMSVGSSSTTFGNQVQNRAPSVTQGALKLQQGVPMPGHVLQSQGNKFSQTTWPNMIQYRGIPTFMDEFKYGFPANGLSSVCVRWWGSGSKEDTERTLPEESGTIEEENKEPHGLSIETSRQILKDDHPDHSTEDIAAITEASASLCSLRRKAVECGCETLKGGISKGYTSCKLGKRQRLALLQVFKSSLPDQWISS
ncbi:uncharacterized protein LOC103703346 [Phoenix dactylifera]|uniref:Uncharacterized protein LOC103703346 n=1 Tax=Phoenix dactylifera TaxID=42345 RepID=A0A8B7BSL7_PHODC|nr:uncharacterized protein LOC103703346 [Phoenix dactylifera]